MGLLYPFPVSEEEIDHVKIKDGKLTVKSYGLPYIFWGYLLAVLIVIFFMAVAIKGPAETLIQSEDPINKLIVYGLLLVIVCVPLGFTTLFFIENRIIKQGRELTTELRAFFIPIRKKKYILRESEAFEVSQFVDSANVARQLNDPKMKAHQNKGYFQLYAHTNDGQTVFIDRHSRKADLNKLISLLEQY